LLDRYLKKTIALFIVIFIAWVSFIPEPWQDKYGLQVKYALSILLLLSLWRRKFDFAGYFFNKNDFLFWSYLFLICLNIPFAQEKKLALGFYKDFSLSAILVFFFFKNELNQENTRKILYGLCLCAGAVCLFGFIEMFTRTNIIYARWMHNYFYERYLAMGRMMSTLTHPNILGAYLVSCFPLAAYFYKTSHLPKVKLFNLALFLVILCGVILTYSRASWFAALFIISVWCYLKKKMKWAILLWAAAALFILLINVMALTYEPLYRFNFSTAIKNVFHGTRIAQYPITFQIIKVHPFVGIGLNSYRELFWEYSHHLWYPYELRIPDSIYLMQLAETGVIGFCGFMLFLGGLFWNARSAYRRLNVEDKEPFLAIMMGFLALLFNIAFFDGFLWMTPLYLFWFFAAAVASFNYRKD
jgi:O-antigen ligase